MVREFQETDCEHRLKLRVSHKWKGSKTMLEFLFHK